MSVDVAKMISSIFLTSPRSSFGLSNTKTTADDGLVELVNKLKPEIAVTNREASKAFKVFKKAEQMLNIKFKVLAQQTSHGRFEIEIGNTKELDPIKISLSQNGRVSVSGWNGENDLGPYKENMWLNFELKLNIKENNFSIIYNNHLTDNLIFNSKKLNYLDRITFRTGLQRGISINPVEPKTDMPLKDNAVFFVDDVEISSN